MKRRKAGVLTVFALAAALSLAGCGGDGYPVIHLTASQANQIDMQAQPAAGAVSPDEALCANTVLGSARKAHGSLAVYLLVECQLQTSPGPSCGPRNAAYEAPAVATFNGQRLTSYSVDLEYDEAYVAWIHRAFPKPLWTAANDPSTALGRTMQAELNRSLHC